MTKENAKEFLPLVQALSDGKTIQFFNCDEWVDLDDPNFGNDIEKYRIKPEEKYVPFDTIEELIDCWNQKKFNGNPPYSTALEMPLIWVNIKIENTRWLITGFEDGCVYMDGMFYSMKELFEKFTFLDGTPIGKIKE